MPNSAISTDAGEVKPRGSPPASNRELEPMTKDQVAFSQPTDAGARLARKWTGKKYGWLVYID
jgi:hypothetical protein